MYCDFPILFGNIMGIAIFIKPLVNSSFSFGILLCVENQLAEV